MKVILCLLIIFCALFTACMQDLPDATATPQVTKRVIPTITVTPMPTPTLPLLTPAPSSQLAPDLDLIVLEKSDQKAVIVVNLADNSIDLVKSISVNHIKYDGNAINFLPLSQDDIALYEENYLIGIFYAVSADIKQNGNYTFLIDITLTDNTVLSWESVIEISN